MSFGTLYIIPTPLGNLKDISLRALETLQTVHLIVAEDTRRAAILLNNYSIDCPVQCMNKDNEVDKAPALVDRLKDGQSIAIISDAGTPGISDPGAHLVSCARDSEVGIVPLPGPVAAITALSAAGIKQSNFYFEGFLPITSGKRQSRLEKLAYEPYPVIFYEAPHRIMKLLSDMAVTWGDDRQLIVAKELTKIHESIRLDSVAGHMRWLEADQARQNGEFVVISTAYEKPRDVCELSGDEVLSSLLDELPLKTAVKLAAKLTNMPRNDLYAMAVAKKDET